MPSITYIAKYKKNTDIVISPEELVAMYFYGVDFRSNDGSTISRETILLYIRSAQREIEKYLDIRLNYQLITETLTYYRDDYSNGFPYFKTSLPVLEKYSLTGLLNGVQQIRYPKEWMSIRRSSDGTIYRQISLVPTGSTALGDANVILLGISAHYGLRTFPQVADYWTVQYSTGWKPSQLPDDVVNLLGLLASIPLFAIYGDLILGSGIASQSLSVDGLSQSISSTSSATNAGFGSRIIEYRKSIDQTKKVLKSQYNGITFTTL